MNQRIHTEQELDEMQDDPEKLRRYYKGIIMHWKRLAYEMRQESRYLGRTYPVQGYRQTFQDGQDLIKWSEALDRAANTLAEHLDEFVEYTVSR